MAIPASSSSSPSPSDPRGSTLWEMFLQWMKSRRSGEPAVSSAALANPLDWMPGTPVSLNAVHGPEFANALTRVEELRHVIRREAGQEFHFVDYVLRVSPRDATPFAVRVRCLPDGQGGWNRLLLRLHDEFGFAADFLEVLNDPSGVFTVEDESPDAALPAEEVSFQRLNDVSGPWSAALVRQRAEPAAGENGDSAAASGSMEYWDFLHTRADETEEFLFVELDGSTGWIQIWRGGRVFL